MVLDRAGASRLPSDRERDVSTPRRRAQARPGAAETYRLKRAEESPPSLNLREDGLRRPDFGADRRPRRGSPNRPRRAGRRRGRRSWGPRANSPPARSPAAAPGPMPRRARWRVREFAARCCATAKKSRGEDGSDDSPTGRDRLMPPAIRFRPQRSRRDGIGCRLRQGAAPADGRVRNPPSPCRSGRFAA